MVILIAQSKILIWVNSLEKPVRMIWIIKSTILNTILDGILLFFKKGEVVLNGKTVLSNH